MTRKDYEAMAKAFGDVLAESAHIADDHQRQSYASGIWAGILAYAKVAAADNPNFNRNLFVDAVHAQSTGYSITGIQLTGQA